MSYSRLVISRALAETNAIWNVGKIWIYFASPLSGILLRIALRGDKQIGNWREILLFALLGFGITWAGTFLINLVRVPPMLYAEVQKECLAVKAETDRLLNPFSGPKWDNFVQRISALDDHEKAVLHALVLQGGRMMIGEAAALVRGKGYPHGEPLSMIRQKTGFLSMQTPYYSANPGIIEFLEHWAGNYEPD